MWILSFLSPNQAVVLCSWCLLAVSLSPWAVLRLNSRWFVVPKMRCFLFSHFFPFAVGNYTQAIECAKTYLLFFPNDEVMSQNLAYYTAMLGEEQARSIGPREVRDLCYLGQLSAEPRPESRVGWRRGSQLLLGQGKAGFPGRRECMGSVGNKPEPSLAQSGPRSLFSELAKKSRIAKQPRSLPFLVSPL